MEENYTASENISLKGWISFSISMGLYAVLFWIAEGSIGTRALALALLPVVDNIVKKIERFSNNTSMLDFRIP